MDSHSVGADKAVTCGMESEVGGQVYEVLEDGTRLNWGDMLVWDPPNWLAYTWQLNRTPEEAQNIEVTFAAARSPALASNSRTRAGSGSATRLPRFAPGTIPVGNSYSSSDTGDASPKALKASVITGASRQTAGMPMLTGSAIGKRRRRRSTQERPRSTRQTPKQA